MIAAKKWGAFPLAQPHPLARRRAVGCFFALGLLILAAGCQLRPARSFPLGMFSVPKSDLAIVRAAGFDTVTGPADQAFLDAAQREGLRVLAAPGTAAGKTFDANRARLTIQQFDSHPALWAWYLVDEPDLHGVPPDDVCAAHRFIKNAGARKPTALVLYLGGEAEQYGNIADLTLVDRYPIPWLPLASVPQHLRMARLALGKKKPLIAVIQAFDWKSYPKLSPASGPTRPPTYAELRCMTYCALARKSTGLFFFCYNDGAWTMSRNKPVWDDVKTVAAEVNAMRPLFQAEHIWWAYRQGYSDRSMRLNGALESSVIPSLLRVEKGNRTVAAGDYLLLINTTEKPLRHRITPPKQLSSIDVLGEGRSVILSNNWLEDDFGPFDVHIYGPIR